MTATKELGRGWDPTYMRRSFFPYWRSVLAARLPMKVYPPAYAEADASRSGLDLEHFRVYRSKSSANGYTPTPDHKLGHVGRISSTSNHQPKRAFSIAAISAFRLLKMLKYARVERSTPQVLASRSKFSKRVPHKEMEVKNY